jgi:hypothetical protein
MNSAILYNSINNQVMIFDADGKVEKVLHIVFKLTEKYTTEENFRE